MLRRGKSLLAREEDVQESGLALFKRGATLRRKRPASTQSAAPLTVPDRQSRKCLDSIGPGPKDAWFIYCYIITCWIPHFMFRACGRHFCGFIARLLIFCQVSALQMRNVHGARK